MRWPWSRPAHVATSARTTESVASGSEDWITDRGAHEAGGWTNGELPEGMRRQAVLKSRREYLKAAVYGGVLDRFVDFVVGDGVTIEAEDKAVDDWLQEVLEQNRFHERLPRAISHLFRDGERLWTVRALDRGTGAPIGAGIRIGQLEPLNVKTLRVDHLDQDDVRELVWAEGQNELDLPLIGPEAEPRLVSAKDGKSRGAHVMGVFWRVNQMGARGVPILIRTMDHAGDLDNLVGNLVSQLDYVRRLWLHVKHNLPDDSKKKDSAVKAFEEKVKAWATSMEPGEVLITGGGANGVEVDVSAPKLEMADAKALYDIVLEMCLGGEGLPKMWFGGGGDTVRATAAEQGTPTFRRITRTQGQAHTMICDLMSAILLMGERAGMPNVTRDAVVNVTMATVATRDSERDVREIAGLAAGLGSAVEMGAVSSEEAAKMVRKVIASKGFGDVLDGEDLPEPEEMVDQQPPPPSGQQPPRAPGQEHDEPDPGKTPPPEVPPKRTKESAGPLRRVNPHRARARV